MVRFVAFNAVFFLLPFLIYAVWLGATRGSIGSVNDWTVRTIGYLAVGGAVLVTIALLFFINFQGAPPGGKYTPATIENGRIVPGHID
jgi:hypothetical protein